MAQKFKEPGDQGELEQLRPKPLARPTTDTQELMRMIKDISQHVLKPEQEFPINDIDKLEQFRRLSEQVRGLSRSHIDELIHGIRLRVDEDVPGGSIPPSEPPSGGRPMTKEEFINDRFIPLYRRIDHNNPDTYAYALILLPSIEMARKSGIISEENERTALAATIARMTGREPEDIFL